jgi:hypothetical protein
MTLFYRTFTVVLVFILCLGPAKTYPQCTKDTECKGARICVNGECVDAPPGSPAPKPCANDVECPGNTICENGICTEPKQNEAVPPQTTNLPQTPDEPVKQSTDVPNIQSSAPKTNESPKSRLSIGPRLGLNFNWCGGKDYELILNTYNRSTETYWGFRLGGALGIRLSSTFTIEPNAYFDQKGKATTDRSGNSEIERDSYLSFPIAAQWYFAANSQLPSFLSGFSPFLSGGPLFAFCLSSTWSIGGETTDVGSDRPDFFFGLLAGAGIAYKAGPGSLVFDVGYTWGLTKIAHSEDFYLYTLSFTIGYRFAL